MTLWAVYTIINWITGFHSDFIWNILGVLLLSFQITHLGTFNIKLMIETTHTFDFWYKLSQAVGGLISAPFVLEKAGYSIENNITFWLFNFFGVAWIILSEAWDNHIIMKLCLQSMIVIWMFIMNIYVYIAFPEVVYDPFNGKFGKNKTVLNWKDIFWNSYSILAIYIGKTIVFAFIYYFKNPDLKKQKLRKSAGLAIRPLIKWHNKSKQQILAKSLKTYIGNNKVNNVNNIHHNHSNEHDTNSNVIELQTPTSVLPEYDSISDTP
eukprot:189212_1